MGILKAAIIGAIIGYAIARSGGRCGGRPGDEKAWFHPVAAPESLAQFGNQVQAKTQVLMDKASKAQAALVERAVKEVNGQIKNQDAQIEKMSDAVKAFYGKLSRVQSELSIRLDSLEKELKAVRAASSKPPCVGVCGRLSAFWYNHTTVGERRAMKWLAAVGAAAGLAVTCHRAMQVLAERRRRDDPVTASGVLRDTMMTFCGHPLPLMPPIMTTAPAAATALPPARNNAPASHDDDSAVDCSRVAVPAAAAPAAPTRQPSSPAACAVEAAKPAVAPRGSTVLQAQQPLVAGMTYVCVFDESGVAHLVPTPAM